MSVRQAVPRPDRDPNDFVGEGRYRRFTPVIAGKEPDKNPNLPPPTEDAILMAAAEAFEHRPRSFRWDNPEDWMHTTWPICIAAWMLWYLTNLDAEEIGNLLGCSGSTVRAKQAWLQGWIDHVDTSKRPEKFGKEMVAKLGHAIDRAEQLAESPIWWLDGVILPETAPGDS